MKTKSLSIKNKDKKVGKVGFVVMGRQNDIRFRLSGLRESRGLTKAYIAEQVLDVSADQYAKIESGNRGLKAAHAIALADFYGVSCDYILRGVEAENVDIYQRTGLLQETIHTLEQRENQHQSWLQKKRFHEQEYRRLIKKMYDDGFSIENDPDNQDFEDSLEHDDEQWQAHFEAEKCAFYLYMMNVLLNNQRLWDMLTRAGEQVVRNTKELYAQTIYGNSAYTIEAENKENAINAAKYTAVMAFAKAFDELCNDVSFITCGDLTPIREEDIPEKIQKWLNDRSK